MTDAQASLTHLQSLTVECPKCKGKPYSFIHPLDGEVEAKCPICQDAHTVPKYPSLYDDETPSWAEPDIQTISLNDLLMDAAKWGDLVELGVEPDGKWQAEICVQEYCFDKADTPIEATLVALSKAEKGEANGN